jgi:transcriptional regulator with XRE-family HTH domain
MAADRHAGGRPRVLPYSALGELIVAQANRRGVHLDQVAADAGISYPTLSRILTGRISSPRMLTIVALADALGLKPERLIVPQRRRTG